MPDDTPQIAFTVKELLADMDARHSAALGRIESSVDSIHGRVSRLEAERGRRQAVGVWNARLWAAGIAVFGIMVNIPAAVFYLRG